MGGSWNVPGAAPGLFVLGRQRLLRPDEQVFEAMLAGWRDQQLSRNLGEATVRRRLEGVRRFQRFTSDWPWRWRPVDLEEFTARLRGERRARSTIRSYHGDLRLFCEYAADPRYEWTAVCERLFGMHPAQICFEWNTAVHAAEYEGEPGRRALAKRELQELFDYADERVAHARERGRKGWLTALRDAAALKTAYAFGLRRRELVMLDLADFGANPHAPEFGDYGVVYVRWGKASKGSPPKRRSVLTVFPWSARVLRQWAEQFRGLFDQAASAAGPVAQRTVGAGVAGEDQRPVRRLPRRARAAGQRVAAQPAPLLYHAPDRGRLRPAVRAAAGGPLLCLDYCAVHVGVVGLPQPDAASGAGPVHPGRPWQGCRTRDGGSVMARRKLDFHWNLRRLMAAHEMWKTTDLVPLLRERGAELSASQVYRLVTDKPERLSMKVLIALCDILDCTPADLIDPYVESAARRKTAGEAAAAVVELKPDLRPERARILDED